MKNKQLAGFLIVSICLLILLALIFIGGYFFYESQKDKSSNYNAIKMIDKPLYYIDEPYNEKIKSDDSSKKEGKLNENELLPDLYLDGFYSDKLNDGNGNVVMIATIRNIGDIEAHNVGWMIIGSDDYSMNVDNDNVIGAEQKIIDINFPLIDVSHSNPIESVKTSESYKITYKFKAEDCPVTVGFFLDPENKIKEKDENNNLKSLEIKGCGEEYSSEMDIDLLQKKMKKVVLYK